MAKRKTISAPQAQELVRSALADIMPLFAGWPDGKLTHSPTDGPVVDLMIQDSIDIIANVAIGYPEYADGFEAFFAAADAYQKTVESLSDGVRAMPEGASIWMAEELAPPEGAAYMAAKKDVLAKAEIIQHALKLTAGDV